MDLDLNIEAVVEGDDQALEDFQDLLEVAQEHAQDPMPVEELPEMIDRNAPPSIDYISSLENSDNDDQPSVDHVPVEESHAALALQASPVNFSVEEIQPHELLSGNPSDESSSSVAGRNLLLIRRTQKLKICRWVWSYSLIT